MRYSLIYITIFLILLLSGCEKREKSDADIIRFGMDEEYLSTKSQMTPADVNNKPVFVYGKMNGTTTLFNETSFTRNPNNIWYPTSTGDNKTWTNGATYTFYAYTLSTNTNITITNFGLTITVTQPSTYNEANMIDFLLSQTYKVNDGITRPLCRLAFEHSMPAVEIYVIKAEAMYEACLKSITLTGIYSKGNMTCTTPATYGTAGRHNWTTNLSGDKSASYTTSGTLASKVNIANTREDTNAKMKVMTMPQQLTSDAKLTIEYWINERTATSLDNYVLYSETFYLYNFSPQDWLAGHKIIYTLKVDSGIHLEGVIAPWQNIDYIEGTILPSV